LVRHGEAASSNKDAAEEFGDKFKVFVDREGFIPEQVFNCDETGLFWGKNAKKDLFFLKRDWFYCRWLVTACT